jgi:hypothetical protein
MPKSEFDSPLRLREGRVTVSGLVGDEGARAREAGTPVRVHWVLSQEDVVSHGVTDAEGSRFSDVEARGLPWKPARAHVSGVTVVVRTAPPGLETFEWEQDVELKTA